MVISNHITEFSNLTDQLAETEVKNTKLLSGLPKCNEILRRLIYVNIFKNEAVGRG